LTGQSSTPVLTYIVANWQLAMAENAVLVAPAGLPFKTSIVEKRCDACSFFFFPNRTWQTFKFHTLYPRGCCINCLNFLNSKYTIFVCHKLMHLFLWCELITEKILPMFMKGDTSF
jgi:hypothetical protein